MNMMRQIEDVVKKIFGLNILDTSVQNDIRFAVAEFSKGEELREKRDKIDPIKNGNDFLLLQDLINNIDLLKASKVLKTAFERSPIEDEEQTTLNSFIKDELTQKCSDVEISEALKPQKCKINPKKGKIGFT